MAEANKRSEKHEEARNSLPSELISVFDEIVADYQHAAYKFHSKPFVSYVVLADMIRAGWRCSAKPINN